jgi:putative SOS response-associated peptidase YedK
MCGRFANARKARELASELAATIASGAEPWPGSYNIGPGRESPILVEVPERRLGLARFGLASASGQLLVSARAETLARRSAFAEAASRRRCIVPATGFYEWQRRHGRKVPHYVHHEAGSEARHTRFAIVTVPASAPVDRVHDRMPLVVPIGLLDSWLLRGELSVEDALSAIAAAKPVALDMHPVSSRVGHMNEDDPSLTAEVDPENETTGLLDLGEGPTRRRRDV